MDSERLVRIETTITDMSKRLFGNGQPGELESLRNRIARIEAWFWRLSGGGAVALFLVERFWR
jgi:hypothetical protein